VVGVGLTGTLVFGVWLAISLDGYEPWDGWVIVAFVLRLGYRALLAVALPGYLLMRAGAEWIADKEGFNAKGAPEPDWLGIGYVVADLGALLLLIALVLGGVGASRVRKGTGGEGLLKATMAITIVLLVAYTVPVWAMAGKPD
jgi:hypothetical protein